MEPSLPVALIKKGYKLQNMALLGSQRYAEISGLDLALEAIAQSNHIPFIFILGLFCEHGACLSSVRNQDEYEPFAWDSSHLTRLSSRLAGERIIEELQRTVSPEY